MVADNYIILSLVKEFMGRPRHDGEDRTQFEFNCKSPKCCHDHNKFNLSYEAERRIFRCWKCSYRGTVYTLVKDHGTESQYDKLKLIAPFNENFNVFKTHQKIAYDLITCELPIEYKSLTEKYNTWSYKMAMGYLEERKISSQQIKKYKIGYTENGDRKHRIIIPSYNSLGKINYFEARSFLKQVKKTYMKPDYPDKNDIIFNESNINWDLPVYLVEGVFDMMRIPNAIPLLGKRPSELLKSMLLKHNSKVIVCLDEDAIDDAYDIYNELSSLGLDTYFIDMSGKGDLSEAYEKYGEQAIIETLKTVKRIEFDSYIEKILKF